MVPLRRLRPALLLAAFCGCVASADLSGPPADAAGDADPPVLTGWPYPDAALQLLPLEVPKGFGRKRIFIDAGHGAPGNTGPPSVFCEREEDFDLRIANDLGARLKELGPFDVLLSRNRTRRPGYKSRVATAVAWGADVFLSIHSDVRGVSRLWQPGSGELCDRNDGEVGFAILFADRAESPLAEERERLAAAIATRMSAAGFLPYPGGDYLAIYDADPQAAGSYVDRHPPGQRIYLLNHTPIPTVIIETHHAWSFPEAMRWREELTLKAFASAVASGLVDALHPPEGG